MSAQRTGPGTREAPKLTPEQAAARIANLERGRLLGRQRKREDMAALAVEVMGMSLDELRQSVHVRYWTVATLYCGGYNNDQIARALGYATRDVVRRALVRPDVKRIIDLIQQAQQQKLINGEFGVQAQAKAAAPKVTRQIIKRAGGIDGEAPALRDADVLRAGETVLRISGDLVDRKEHVHVTWLQQMAKDDPKGLQHFIDTGEWPEKYRHIAESLDAHRAAKAIDVTPGRS